MTDRGDIFWVSLDPTSGHEQRGHRPVLIVTTWPFNRLTGTPLVVPITTSGNFSRMAGFAVDLAGSGLQTHGVIRCDQPRVLDLSARRGRKVETVPEVIMNEVLARVATLLD